MARVLSVIERNPLVFKRIQRLANFETAASANGYLLSWSGGSIAWSARNYEQNPKGYCFNENCFIWKCSLLDKENLTASELLRTLSNISVVVVRVVYNPIVRCIDDESDMIKFLEENPLLAQTPWEHETSPSSVLYVECSRSITDVETTTGPIFDLFAFEEARDAPDEIDLTKATETLAFAETPGLMETDDELTCAKEETLELMNFRTFADKYWERVRGREEVLDVIEYMQEIEDASEEVVRFFDRSLKERIPHVIRNVEDLPNKWERLLRPLAKDLVAESVSWFLDKCLELDELSKSMTVRKGQKRVPLTVDRLGKLLSANEALGFPGAKSLNALKPGNLDCDRELAENVATGSLIKELLRRSLTDREKETLVQQLLATQNERVEVLRSISPLEMVD